MRIKRIQRVDRDYKKEKANKKRTKIKVHQKEVIRDGRRKNW